MKKIRILHVDDEADIREVVEIALGLDPTFKLRSCGCGERTLAIAEAWRPDIILLDVMMPTMDGPATLAKLRERAATSEIPVIFMTARAQSSELLLLKTLGAVGVIRKPFDPMTLAATVRSYVDGGTARIGTMRHEFLERFERDLITLFECWRETQTAPTARESLSAMKSLAHGLAGAGGIFGFNEISRAAAHLEDAILDERKGLGSLSDVAIALKGLQGFAEKKIAFQHNEGVSG